MSLAWLSLQFVKSENFNKKLCFPKIFEELAEKIMSNRQIDTFSYDQLVQTPKSKLNLHSDYKKMKEKKLPKSYSFNLFDAQRSSKTSIKTSDQSFNESINSSITQYTDQNDTQSLFKQVSSHVSSDGRKNEIYQSSPIKSCETAVDKSQPTAAAHNKTNESFESKVMPKSQSAHGVHDDDITDHTESISFQNLRISKSDNQINIKTETPVNISIQSREDECETSKPKSAAHQLLEKFNEQRQQNDQAPYKLQLLVNILKNQFTVLNMQFNAINGEICALNTVINAIKYRT